MKLMWTERHGDELYVYCCGVCIYKKWLKTGQSRMFHEGEAQRAKTRPEQLQYLTRRPGGTRATGPR